VIGAGPAGLIAAETLAAAGYPVDLFEGAATLGRKLLVAGRGGLNLTHSEPFEALCARYGAAAAWMRPHLDAFGPDALRAWAAGLGIETFVGSSGRVFPTGMKAAPLLRAWVRRLRALGVRVHLRHRWEGWEADGRLRFATPEGVGHHTARAVILALGGASWPHLGSDGAWVAPLAALGIGLAPLRPANCGFDLAADPERLARLAGQRLPTVTLSFGAVTRRGEITLTATGIEGGLVYGLSAALREAIAADGLARPRLDLLPDWPAERIADRLAAPRGARSLSTVLRRVLPLSAPAVGLLALLGPHPLPAAPHSLAALIKGLDLPLIRPRPIAEAISTAGGVCLDEVGSGLMLRRRPGCFVAGEMLDWEAPTGGYLLTGCFATGRAAALGAADWMDRQS